MSAFLRKIISEEISAELTCRGLHDARLGEAQNTSHGHALLAALERGERLIARGQSLVAEARRELEA